MMTEFTLLGGEVTALEINSFSFFGILVDSLCASS